MMVTDSKPLKSVEIAKRSIKTRFSHAAPGWSRNSWSQKFFLKVLLQIFFSISNRHLIGVLCMVGRNGGDIELWDFLQKCLVKGSLCIYLVVSYWASLFKNVNFKSEIKLNKASYSLGLENRKKGRDQRVWFQGCFLPVLCVP